MRRDGSRTAWSGRWARRLRRLLGGESGGAIALIAAAVAALVWANVGPGSYEAVWHTDLAVQLGGRGMSQDLRAWVDGGLMTFFFFVVGLDARRELDLGELRERSRVVLPVTAGLAGMAVPIGLYLAITAGTPAASGWGVAMSTDTALALGLLAGVGVRSPALRSFLLTVLVVDDLAALTVIAVVYTEHVGLPALLAAVALLVVVLLVRAAGIRLVGVYVVLGVAVWAALVASGLDPVVAGLVLGLLTLAYPAEREDLERATTSCARSASNRRPNWPAPPSPGSAPRSPRTNASDSS